MITLEYMTLFPQDCLGTGVSALGSETVSSVFYILGVAGVSSGIILVVEIVYK